MIGCFSGIPESWVGVVGDGITFAWTLTGKPVIPSSFTNLSRNRHCVVYAGTKLGNLDCTTPAWFICKERVKKRSCCNRTSNIFVNIKQNV